MREWLGELVVLTTSSQDGRLHLYCTWLPQGQEKLHWKVNKETGKGECKRLGHKFYALTLPKYLANPKHKCQGQSLSSICEDTIAERSWPASQISDFQSENNQVNYLLKTNKAESLFGVK